MIYPTFFRKIFDYLIIKFKTYIMTEITTATKHGRPNKSMFLSVQTPTTKKAFVNSFR